VLAAGSDATDHPELYLQAGAAAVITGEGEITMVEALRALSDGGPDTLAAVAGLALRDAAGSVARTRPRPIIRHLDGLPRPAWDLVDIEHYRAVWLRHHGYFSMNVATTRGCPYHCNWCAKPIYGQRYTARAPEAVAEEIAWLRARFEPDHLWIADDIFGLQPGWIERFAGLQVAHGNVVPFKCLLRADGVTDPIARALAAAGCRTAWIGAESGSQRILDAMEKGTRVAQIEAASRLLHAQGIEVGFFLQFGYPGEAREDIEQTIAMVDRCRPDDIGVSVSYPLPGTPFYERVRRQMGATQNWVDSEDLAMMYRATFVPDFYRALHAVVHARFRASRALDRLRGRPRGGELSRRPVRDLLSGVLSATRMPLLRRRLERLALSSDQERGTPLPPLLSRHSAAIPTEQPQ
jgi:anaerobic magnesium-protoporphyrin IX monomethyl ester cyclase